METDDDLTGFRSAFMRIGKCFFTLRKIEHIRDHSIGICLIKPEARDYWDELVHLQPGTDDFQLLPHGFVSVTLKADAGNRNKAPCR